MILNTRVCEILSIEHPVVLAGLGIAAGTKLAAAVSNAGGLGVLGAACGPSELRERIRRTRELTNKPFGVEMLLPMPRQTQREHSGALSTADRVPDYLEFAESFMEQHGLAITDFPRAYWRDCEPRPFTQAFFNAQMQVIIDERVPIYAGGLGHPESWMAHLHANGIKVIAAVGTVRHAIRALRADVDLVVARGHDSAGHNSLVGTMSLVPQVVDAVGGGLPVLAAGGIADGRGLAAALMLGAQGVCVGSAFLAAEEADIPAFQKQALIEATDESTVISRAITGKPCRVLRSAWTDAWERDDIEPLPMPYQSLISAPVLAAAAKAGRSDIYPGIGGQAVGLIRAVRPARQILDDMIRGATAALGGADMRFAPTASTHRSTPTISHGANS